MQHRSLIRRGEWRPNTAASEKSPVRYHSPYCEATGPIVHEGFVASRIRTLQALSNHAFEPIRSHSPMLRCPPLWPHEHQHLPPPTQGFPARSSVKGHDGPETETILQDGETGPSKRTQKQCIEASDQTMGLSEAVLAQSLIDLRHQAQRGQTPIEPPDTLALQSPHSDAVATGASPTIGRCTPSENRILSPRAIPASLAEPSKPRRDFSQTGSYDSENSEDLNLRPRKSIADKLGSMVERGWVGYDVIGKAYNEHIPNNQERVKRRSQSSVDHPQRTRPLLLKRPQSFSHSEVASGAQDSTVPRNSYSNDDNATRLAKHSPPTRVHEPGRATTTTRKGAQRSSSDAGISRDDSRASSSSRKYRTFSLRHLSRLRRSQSQQFELDPIKAGHSLDQRHEKQDRKTIYDFLSSGNTKRERHHEPDAPPGEQQDQTSETTSLAPNSRRASTNTTHSSRSATRSGSWFKKYRFFPKLVSADNPPALWDFSNDDSVDTAVIRANGDSQQDSLVHSDQDQADVSNTNKLVSESRGTNSEASASPTNLCVLKEPGVNDNVECMSQNISSRLTQLQITASPQGSDSSRVSEQIKSQIEPPPTSSPSFANAETPTGDQERYPPKKLNYYSRHERNPLPESSLAQGKRPSKSRSTDMTLATEASSELHTGEPTKESPIGSQTSTSTASVTLPLNRSSGYNSPALPSPVHIYNTPRGRSPIRSSQRHVSDVVELPLEHPADSNQSSPQVDEATQTVGRGRRASEKRIKKIQVTVTLDGAEELVIEAKLQRKQGWDGWSILQ